MKFLSVFLVLFGMCFSSFQEFTKFYHDIDYYVIGDKYLISTDHALDIKPNLLLDLPMLRFFRGETWILAMPIPKNDPARRDYEIAGKEPYYNVTFYPEGVFTRKRLSLKEFENFVSECSEDLKVCYFKKTFNNKDLFSRKFEVSTKEFKDEERLTLTQLVELYRNIDKRMHHKFHLVYSQDSSKGLVGVIGTSIVGLTTVTTYARLEK